MVTSCVGREESALQRESCWKDTARRRYLTYWACLGGHPSIGNVEFNVDMWPVVAIASYFAIQRSRGETYPSDVG